MNAPARISKASDPALIAFVEALARAQVARDIAALRAVGRLYPLFDRQGVDLVDAARGLR